MATDLKQNRNVDADMEGVFGLGTARLEAPATAEAAALPSPAPVARRPRRWLLIAAPVLVALFVAALAVRFALTIVPQPVPAPVRSERAAPAAYTASAPAPVPLPSPTLAAVETVAPDDFGPAPVDRPPPAPSTPAVPRSVERRQQPARLADVDCPPGSHEDRCIFADVLAADNRLRSAYRRATDAGVPTDTLVAIRRRWTRARAISLDSPDETIRRYGDLTAALDDLVETEQR